MDCKNLSLATAASARIGAMECYVTLGEVEQESRRGLCICPGWNKRSLGTRVRWISHSLALTPTYHDRVTQENLLFHDNHERGQGLLDLSLGVQFGDAVTQLSEQLETLVYCFT